MHKPFAIRRLHANSNVRPTFRPGSGESDYDYDYDYDYEGEGELRN